jgi:ribose 5-phosphate isomerase B
MKIAVGSDHRGYKVKAKVIELLENFGHESSDQGTHSEESVDYPDIASAVSSQVASGEVDRGILICGTGIGMAITANKFAGVRAAAVYDEVAAELCRRHNDVNVLCLSGDMLGERNIEQLIQLWLETEFDAGRHTTRLEKIARLEQDAVE